MLNLEEMEVFWKYWKTQKTQKNPSISVPSKPITKKIIQTN
jgi:hypothetical protein